MKSETRRRPRGRPAGGSEAIVRAVLSQTLQQLGEHGFAALRMENVACAARVNKTTVYRRWPTKAGLVLAALKASRERAPYFAESGELRDDLVRLLESRAAAISTPRGRKIANAVSSLDGRDAMPMAAEIQALRFRLPTQLLHHAIDRRELPAKIDFTFVNEMLHGPIVHRILILKQRVDRRYVERVVDFVLTSLQYKRRGARRQRAVARSFR